MTVPSREGWPLPPRQFDHESESSRLFGPQAPNGASRIRADDGGEKFGVSGGVSGMHPNQTLPPRHARPIGSAGPTKTEPAGNCQTQLLRLWLRKSRVRDPSAAPLLLIPGAAGAFADRAA